MPPRKDAAPHPGNDLDHQCNPDTWYPDDAVQRKPCKFLMRDELVIWYN